jgi:hypothetical protein
MLELVEGLAGDRRSLVAVEQQSRFRRLCVSVHTVVVSVRVVKQDVLLQPNPPAVPNHVGPVGEERVDKGVLGKSPMGAIVLNGEAYLCVEDSSDGAPEKGSLSGPVVLAHDSHHNDEGSAHPKFCGCVPEDMQQQTRV